MKNEFRTVKFDDREYALIPMPPIKAMGFSLRVAQLVGGLLSQSDLKDLAAKASKGDGMGAVTALLPAISGLDAEKAEALIREALDFEVHAGPGKLSDKAHFDSWFRDNPGDLLPVGVWAIWEHSKDFLFGAVGNFRHIMGGVGTTPNPSKSTKSG